jgi:hypothetical protein
VSAAQAAWIGEAQLRDLFVHLVFTAALALGLIEIAVASLGACINVLKHVATYRTDRRRRHRDRRAPYPRQLNSGFVRDGWYR